MHIGRRLLIILLVASVPAVGAAQEITGTITGTVRDQTGQPLAGATVGVRHLGRGLLNEFVTTETGRYTAPFMPPGEYELTFTMPGFQPHVARGITLHVNDRLEINATLAVGGVTETVEVNVATQFVQPTPAVQALMGPTQVQELPLNNRNFVELTSLVPGVASSLSDEVGVGLTSTVSISINGARRNGVNWLLDGAMNVDVGSNITLLSTPTLESIQEFKIITSSYAAEWPRSGGGIINLVTKSGTNEFRGSAYEYLRNDGLNANSFFRKQSSDPTLRDHPSSLRYNNFGYTLGGPIKKDALFFFWSEEWRRIKRAPSSVTANVPDPAFLSDPSNPNYVPAAQRDPNAVALLSAWPAPNVGTNHFVDSRPNDQNTRQEVVRLDWVVSPRWRVMGRYTHDLSQTQEPGGLFFNTRIPNIATTKTDVPGQVLVAQIVTTISPHMLNEFSYQFSGNEISSTNPPGTKNKRSDYGINIPQLFSGNVAGLIPFVNITGLDGIGSKNLFDIQYRNHTFADNLSFQRGNHAFKAGVVVTFEQKNENASNDTQGTFNFVAGGGFTAFQNFLRGNVGGACGAGCTYVEPQQEIRDQLRFNRHEFYVQDSFKVRPGLTLDLGVRYSLFPSVVDNNNLLTTFSPALYDPSRAPSFANAAGTLLLAGTGDPLNGIVVAGQNSPHGRGLYATDTKNIQPRVGFSWDPKGDEKTVVRGGYGIYYDQPLVGIFEQNSFVNPPFNRNVTILNPMLSNPAAGTSPATTGLLSLIASSDPFKTPRTMQWNVGVQRQLYARGVVELTYVGSSGDSLIQPVDINQPQPQDVLALGSLNRARPYLGWGSINNRQTTARSRYHGLLVAFRHEAGRSGTLNLSYTLSRNMTTATNDRDAIDLPQNPRNLDAEYAVARTDRTHVFTANYVYELPFFKDGAGVLKALLGGWQVAGLTEFWSGPPISRVVNGTTNGGRRGIRVDQVSDPLAGLPANPLGGVYWFNPAAFASPADGTYGNTGRAIFRLPGVNQWDITLSKNWYPSKEARVQFRADFINAFNHTQLDPVSIQNVCGASTTNPTCAVAGSPLGEITGTRLPREIQLGLKFFWR